MAYLIWQLLTESAREHPDRPAVQAAGGAYTYAELDAESARIASVLGAAGIGPGDRVAILAPKGHRCVAIMLGVSRTGAAYVPIDPHAPARRAATILADCAVRALFTSRAMLAQLSEHAAELPDLGTVVLVDAESGPGVADGGVRIGATLGWAAVEAAEPAPERGDVAIETDPAYLLYTSGSTGRPKGVILTHRNALAFVEWGANSFEIGPEDRLSNHAPLHFDLSVFDIYAALARGACVVLVPDRVAPFPMELASWIDRERISVWYSVPSALTRMLLHGRAERFEYRALRTVLFAGEVFPVKYLREVMERMPSAGFFNLYGPTETNVCTWHEVRRPLPPEATAIPVGRACANTECFALRDDGGVAGAGETGELLVRGPTVMPGYWGLPERSREALPPDPRQAAYEERTYRTGDLVRVGEHGEFWFVGRRDHMVKSRGYRIELGEIEQAILAHPDVREAAVVALPDDEIGARLVAFVAPRNGHGSIGSEAVASFVASRVPRYMVPETVLLRDALPQTSTGKIDRQALASDVQ
jgi:amino acid adenylation domain-containing protein